MDDADRDELRRRAAAAEEQINRLLARYSDDQPIAPVENNDDHEARIKIIQVILGHPSHLPSLRELDYFIPDTTEDDITDQLDQLQAEGIIDEYTYESNQPTRGLPWKFYGPTEYGIKVLSEFNYLRGVPMAQAIIKKTRTTEKITRHLEAPRPSLPAAVHEALRLDEENKDR